MSFKKIADRSFKRRLAMAFEVKIRKIIGKIVFKFYKLTFFRGN